MSRVLHGPLAGKTKVELIALERTLQDELLSGTGSITGASVSGQSFSQSPGLSVEARLRLVQSALAQVDPDRLAPSSSIRVRFGAG